MQSVKNRVCESSDAGPLTYLAARLHGLIGAVLHGGTHDAYSDLLQDLSGLDEHKLPVAGVDALLIRTLAILDRHSVAHCPTLVERYLTPSQGAATGTGHFRRCWIEASRYRAISDPIVVEALHTLDDLCTTPDLKVQDLACALETTPRKLATLLRRHTGLSFREHVRQRRLNIAARRLQRQGGNIKSVWTSIGYSHASDFTRHFKARFGVPPRGYRTMCEARGSADDSEGSAAIQIRSPILPSIAPRIALARIIIIGCGSWGQWLLSGLRQRGHRDVIVAPEAWRPIDVVRCRAQCAILDEDASTDSIVGYLRAVRELGLGANIIVVSSDWDGYYSMLLDLHRLNASLVLKPADTIDVMIVAERQLLGVSGDS